MSCHGGTKSPKSCAQPEIAPRSLSSSDPPSTVTPTDADAGSITVLNFVGGSTVASGSGKWIPLIDPVTGSKRGALTESDASDVDAAVAASEIGGRIWAGFPLEKRCAILNKAADLLEQRIDAFALAESADTGKPLAMAKAFDVPRTAATFRFFAGLAVHANLDEFRSMDGPMSALNYTVRKPAGNVALITPWNLPMYLLAWKAAPALAMGNGIVAKPAPNSPTTAVMLGEVLREAGLPDGAYNVVQGTGPGAGDALIRHEKISVVGFTGGTESGRFVAAAAAPLFKKLSLELGGKNSAIVFADCSFDDTVAAVGRSVFLNSGQVCLCTERILIEDRDGFCERFTEALRDYAKSLRVGSPMDPSTDLGPLISHGHRANVQKYIELAKSEGGSVICGGGAPENLEAEFQSGAFFEPTLITGLAPEARAAQEEIFGPVASIHPFRSDEEAVQLANGTKFGLAASVFTESLDRAHQVSSSIDVGIVWVNDWLQRSMHMPFGGTKNSGVGREGGLHSLGFFSEESTVCIRLGSRKPPPMPGAFAKLRKA